jgi:hypothetical protein
MADLSSLGSGSLGLWTRPEALALLTRGAVQHLLDSGVWQSAFRGVYADGGYLLSAQQWAFATVLATGGAGRSRSLPVDPDRSRGVVAACGRTAARVWGFPLIDDDDPATGATERYVHDVHTGRHVASRTAPPLPGERWGHQLRRHRLTLLPGELVEHPNGLWLTTPLRTAVDCVGLLGHEAGTCVLDHALHRHVFDEGELWAAVAARAGWPGVEALRRAVELADRRAEAPSETLARLLLQPVLPSLVPQVRVRDGERVVARFDLGDEQVRLGVDMDAKDRARDRRTEHLGWWTERGTWFEVRRQQQALQARVVARHAQLRARTAA